MAETSKVTVEQLRLYSRGAERNNDLRFRKVSDKIGLSDLSNEVISEMGSGSSSSFTPPENESITFPNANTIVETTPSQTTTTTFSTDQSGNDVITETIVPTSGSDNYTKTTTINNSTGAINIVVTTTPK